MAYGGLNIYIDAAAEIGRNPISKHGFGFQNHGSPPAFSAVPLLTTFFLFFSSLISLIADGPHHYHPVCGHKGSSHLSPVHALQIFIAMQVQHSYNSSTNG